MLVFTRCRLSVVELCSQLDLQRVILLGELCKKTGQPDPPFSVSEHAPVYTRVSSTGGG